MHRRNPLETRHVNKHGGELQPWDSTEGEQGFSHKYLEEALILIRRDSTNSWKESFDHVEAIWLTHNWDIIILSSIWNLYSNMSIVYETALVDQWSSALVLDEGVTLVTSFKQNHLSSWIWLLKWDFCSLMSVKNNFLLGFTCQITRDVVFILFTLFDWTKQDTQNTTHRLRVRLFRKLGQSWNSASQNCPTIVDAHSYILPWHPWIGYLLISGERSKVCVTLFISLMTSFKYPTTFATGRSIHEFNKHCPLFRYLDQCRKKFDLLEIK